MKATDVKFLARAAGARLFGNGDAYVTGVKIDSRAAGTGDLFVCIVGEKNDGHHFARGAYDAGCRVFLMSNPEEASSLLEYTDGATVLLAQNTEIAFRKMAIAYLDQFGVHKIAVTGSVGKTTTKNLTATVLSAKYNTVRTEKNLNSQLGLCLTCFLADEQTEAVVFEMGMDGKGQIEEKCSWIKPEAAIITNVGISHLERLGSKENIAKAKLEITKHMNKSNVLVYNCDSEFLNSSELYRLAGDNFRAVPVGKSLESSISISNIKDNGLLGISFKLTSQGQSEEITLPILGLHNAENAALACAMGLQYGVSLKDAAAALLAADSEDRRLHSEMCDGVYLLDDSYNASPASMCAGLDVLAQVPGGRKIAVLADMYELGIEEVRGHMEVGKRAAEDGIDVLIACGKNRRLYASAAEKESYSIQILECETPAAACGALKEKLKQGDVVLVKGSNATGICAVAEMIRNRVNK